MTDSQCLTALRRSIGRIERQRPSAPAETVALGVPAVDAAIGGGLQRGRLHEVFAAEAEDGASAAGFGAMLARRLSGAIVWLRQEEAERRGGSLHAPGLAEVGIDPGSVLLCVLPDPLSLLRAAADVVRSPGVGVALVELWRRPRELDLTASRRLALAAEESGVTVLMLRIEAEPAPSAAQTRWAVCAAPSQPLDADAPGHPALAIELMRQRGGPAGGRWQVEWDRDEGIFRETAAGEAAGGGAPSSGAVLPVPGPGPAAPRRQSA